MSSGIGIAGVSIEIAFVMAESDASSTWGLGSSAARGAAAGGTSGSTSMDSLASAASGSSSTAAAPSFIHMPAGSGRLTTSRTRSAGAGLSLRAASRSTTRPAR